MLWNILSRIPYQAGAHFRTHRITIIGGSQLSHKNVVGVDEL